MSMAERIALISALASSCAALAALGGLILAIMNRGTLKEVHKTTNGLSQRAEAYAHEAGKAEGKQQEKDNPS